MNRSIVHGCAWVALVSGGLIGFAPAARGQGIASTATASVAESEAAAPAQPPRCRFEELLRVELRDRKLAIVMVPPKALAEELAGGGSAAVAIVDSDTFDWRISGGRDGDGAKEAAIDGRYARFSVATSPDHFDRWSPLQLSSVTSDDALEIIGGGRVGRTSVSVTYRQDRAPSAVRLTVERSRGRGRAGRPLHAFNAPDLLQLWNDHQRECRTFLVPLLRTIAPRENVLRPRAGDVYRAFDAIPADAEVTRQVRAILPELEAESPAAREAASAKIDALGPAGVLAILRMDRGDCTPEQTARLGAIVQRHSTLRDPAGWRRDIYFLTDCLEDADPAVRRAALDAVRAVAGRDVEFDLDADAQARSAAAQEVLRALEATAAGR